jgi:hypothetical protein
MNTIKISKDIINIINKYNLPSKKKIEEYKYYRYFELYNLFRYEQTLPSEIIIVKNRKYGIRSVDNDNNLLNHYTYPKFPYNPNIIKCIYCGISCSIDGHIQCNDLIWLDKKFIKQDFYTTLLPVCYECMGDEFYKYNPSYIICKTGEEYRIYKMYLYWISEIENKV